MRMSLNYSVNAVYSHMRMNYNYSMNSYMGINAITTTTTILEILLSDKQIESKTNRPKVIKYLINKEPNKTVEHHT